MVLFGLSGWVQIMKNDTFSNHIGSASELTILADIKPGFVPTPQPLTYAARLRTHLRMLSALRRNGLESDRAGVYVGPIDSLQTLQYVRWTLVENDTKMLLAVNFDRPFEPYVRRIVDLAGPLLDTILCHCIGFEGHSSDLGFDKFYEYATRHQVPVELFAAAAPNLSVDDGDYYLKMDRHLREDPSNPKIEADLARLQIDTPAARLAHSKQTARLALLDQGLNILRIMYENAERFPFQDETSRDDLLYWNLTNRLIPDLFEGLSAFTHVDRSQDGWRQKVLDTFLDPSPSHPPKLPQNPSPQEQRVTQRVIELLTDFREPLRWFAKQPTARNVTRVRKAAKADFVQRGLLAKSVPNAQIEVQGGTFRATHACLLLMRIDDPAQGAAFLDQMRYHIWPEDVADQSVNLSITHKGLKSLDVPEAVRNQFPAAFREGMAARAGLLGDTDCNHPKEWNWPVRNWPLDAQPLQISPESIDLIVRIEAVLDTDKLDPAFDADHPMCPQVAAVAALGEEHNVRLLHVDAMQRRMHGGHVQGHLNFADGISQPDFARQKSEQAPQPWDDVQLGDLLLGHQTQLDSDKTFAQYSAPLQNGTFQVVRKIQLDVAGFQKQAGNVHQSCPHVDPKTVMEKMVGRQQDGTNFETGTQSNDFDFNDDPDGAKTPLQSHVRRVNPREKAKPRILRRGFSYGPFAADPPTDDGVDRGLMFIAYNANIAEQFEIIQRWISGGNSTGISSWHGDPLLAPRRAEGSRAFRFLQGDDVVTVGLNPKPIGVLQWGLYAFTPSLNGLMAIAKGTYDDVDTDAGAQSDPVTIATQPDKDRWKQFLEDPDDENRADRDAFWSDLRDKGKPKCLGDFGVAIPCPDQVKDILVNEGDRFSVCEYGERMKDTIGVQYLGVDDRARHEMEREILTKFLNTDLDEQTMFDDVFAVATEVLTAQPDEAQSLESDGSQAEPLVKKLGIRLESRAFIHQVTARLSVKWFGIPEDDFDIGGPLDTARPHCPRDFLAASYYLFTPHPTDFSKVNSQNRTPMAVDALRDFIDRKGRDPFDAGSLLGKLDAARKADVAAKKPEFWTSQKMAEYTAGSCFGLVGPVTGSFRSVLFDWIKEDKLWRLQQRLHEQGAPLSLAAARDVLRPAILSSMSERPIADLLFRRTTKDVEIAGTTIPADRKVIFSQRSAILGSGDAETFLFGGDYEAKVDDKAMHKCPGKTMGLAIMMGCFAAMMHKGTLRPEGPLSVRIKTQS